MVTSPKNRKKTTPKSARNAASLPAAKIEPEKPPQTQIIVATMDKHTYDTLKCQFERMQKNFRETMTLEVISASVKAKEED